MNNIILLDLDGVLIIHAPWRRLDIHEDGYSDFDPVCVRNLNTLIEETGYDIVLSSARRTAVDIDQMNSYFKVRGVSKEIVAYVPDYNVEGEPWKTRREELELFLEENKPENYLIIDDDKSLSDATEEIKSNWIQTYLTGGLKNIER